MAQAQTMGDRPKGSGARGLLVRYRVWIGVAISAILLYLTFGRQDWAAIGAALQKVNYVWLLPALAAYFTGVWLRALRWHFLLSPMLPKDQRAHAGANRLFGPITIGYAANNILPLRTGELVRVLALKQAEGVAGSAALATIVVERIFDGLTMLLFLVVAAMFVTLGALSSYLIVGGIIFVGLLVAFVVIAGSPVLADRVLNVVLNILPIGGLRVKVGEKARSFLNGLSALRSPRVAGTVMLVSIILWLFETLMAWLIAQGIPGLLLPNGNPPPFYVFVLMTAVANLVLIVPSTAGGLGPFDAAINVVLASVFGIVQTVAATFAIIFRVALWLPVTIVGLIFLSRAGIGWSDMTGGKRAQQHDDFLSKVEDNIANNEHDDNNDNMEDDRPADHK